MKAVPNPISKLFLLSDLQFFELSHGGYDTELARLFSHLSGTLLYGERENRFT